MWMRLGQSAVVWGLAAVLAACGGGNDEPAATPGVATVGAAGGAVLAADGAQIVFPKNALRVDTTVRIAMDSTGAPPLPPAAVAAGPVYAITPHGSAFDELVEVSIPVERADVAGDGQLLLVTAEPGDTHWRVLSGASYYDGKMRAPVMQFSFFRTIRLVNQFMPTLVTKIDGANNIGGTGTARISALANLPFLTRDNYGSCGTSCPIPVNTVVAELSFPTLNTGPNVTPIGFPATAATPPTQCRPVDHGHNAMSFRFTREGRQVFSPTVDHSAVVPRDPWPRFPGDGGALGFTDWTTIGWGAFPGFGALHYYGNESPRIGGLHDANPPTQAQIDRAFAERNSTAGRYVLPAGNFYALPPASDNTADNLYTWRGNVRWSAAQNGSVRIDAAIMTSCGLLLDAVPLAFKLDAPPPQGYRTRDVIPLDLYGTSTSVADGAGETLSFGLYEHGRGWLSNDAGITYRVDFSPNPTTTDWQPVAPAAVTNFRRQTTDPHTFETSLVAGVQVNLPAVQVNQSGYYRVFWCGSQGCFAGPAYQLVVVQAPPTISAQPAGQTVQVGETASFTVATAGAPAPTLQWQKRSFLAAAFGFLAWTNIDGAIAATYTTPPRALADTATQYRVWATNAQGSVASDIAMLTVVEQFAPPVFQSQPGNLNVTVGGTAVFATTAAGAAPLSYQWRRNGSNVTGANAPILTLANVSALNDGRYDLVVTNRAGSVTSEPAVLVVTLGTQVALPPTIAAPPASITVAAGNTANFAVAVNGTGPYTYLWMKNGVQAPIPNGDFPSFGIASVTAADAGSYTVRVTNNVGTVVSAAATLTVTASTGISVAPAITTPPIALAVLPGAGATLAVAVTGTAPLTYQWRRNGIDIAGATGAVLHIAAATAFDAGQYAVEVRNAVGVASSSAAPLIIIGAPAITQQPAATTAAEGSTAAFSVGVSGDSVLYLWTRNQVVIAGATSASHTTPKLTFADNGAVYGVVVYNGAGIVFSQGAVLTVTPLVAPTVSTQPLSQSVVEPATMTFTVGATGTPAPTLQWQLSSDGGATWANIAGATASSYTTPATAVADSGRRYRAVASNPAGTVNSNGATLTVTALVVAKAWQNAALIETGNAGEAQLPQIAVNAPGDAIAVWQQSDGVSIDIYANRYTAAAGWGTAQRIETNNTGVAQNAQVALDSSGNAIAVWQQRNDAGRDDIWANRYTAGVGWGVAVLIENGFFDAGNPQVAIDGSGNAIAVWWQHGGGRRLVANRYVAGSGWGTGAVIDTGSTGEASAPQIAMDAGGNAIAVWAWNSAVPNGPTYEYTVWANRYTPASGWGTAGPIDSVNNSNPVPAPHVALDGSGNAIAVWHRPDGSWDSIWANRYAAGSGWGTPVLVETDNTNSARAARVAFDASGNAFAVWTQSFGGVANVMANRYAAGIGWGSAVLIETDDAGPAFEPSLVVDGNGNATAVWSQRNIGGFTFNIWTNRFTAGTGWGTARMIDNDPSPASAPQIGVDANGNAVSVWQQDSGGVRPSIWANSFR